MGTGTIALIALAAVLATVVLIYNRLVTLKNRVGNAYSQIDVQLQRRYELIPNLVETARVYLEHERETLTAVTQARNSAEQQRKSVAAAGAGPSPRAAGKPSVATLAAADRSLAGALGQLNVVMEAYPDLKADRRLSELHEDLASTENRVGFARQAYSDAVMSFNTGIEQFPAVIVARLMRFDQAELFEAADPVMRQAVTVSFASAEPRNAA